MLVRQFTLKLNAGASVNPVIYTNQNDYGELWCFTLINGTEVITPSQGTLIGLSSDGQTYAVDGYVDELGRACITETTEITSTPGRGEYELSIGGHGTANFYVETEARPTDGIVVSEDEKNYFNQVIEQTGANAQAAQTAAEQVVAYTDFSTRTEKTTPDSTDIIPMQTADGTAVKIDYDKLAKAIIEQYTSTEIGSTVADAIQTLNNSISHTYTNASRNETYASGGIIRYWTVGKTLIVQVSGLVLTSAVTESVAYTVDTNYVASGLPATRGQYACVLNDWTDHGNLRMKLANGRIYFHYAHLYGTGSSQYNGYILGVLA